MRASERFDEDIAGRLEGLREEGLYKSERVISSMQAGEVRLADGREVINLCANNYLGLADHPEIIKAAHEGLDRYGFGMASVRFICGTQEEHKALEARIAGFLGMEDSILYAAAFDANAGLFETLLGPEDAIISDALNHASIIDGVRLCKARRFRYANSRHGGSGAVSAGGGRCAAPADRHRWGVSRWMGISRVWARSVIWPSAMTRW